MRIIVGKRKEIWFACKINGCDWPHEMGVDILIWLCCSQLGTAIVLFLDFCLFAAIIDVSLCIIDEFNIVTHEMFFQCGEVEMAKSLMTWGKLQLFALHLVHFWFLIDFVTFEKIDSWPLRIG